MNAGCRDLVGQFFLTFDDEGNLEFRGQILSCPEPGYYLCQLLNWMGEPSCAKLAQISEMLRWSLYSSDYEWRDACEANKNHSGALSDRRKNVPINDVFSRRLETER